MKHNGSFDDLQAIVRAVGFNIEFAGRKGNAQQIRTKEGAIINWYESTGKIQFQGKQEPKQRLESAIATYMGEIVNGNNQIAVTSRIKSTVTDTSHSKKIFVVHGHDVTAREQLELILHRLGLNPFVLQNTGGTGLTLIEELEKEIGNTDKSAKFGIVLMTPDDMGYAKKDGPDNAQPRARQNVVLEMGMLISALGRSRVAILKKGHLEIPSDASGILYIPFNDHVKEVVPKLVDRLRSAGFVFSPEQISRAQA